MLDKERVEELCNSENRELQIPRGTAYLLTEQRDGEGSVTRAVYNRGEEYLHFMRSTGAGYLTGEYLGLIWK